MFRCFPSVLLSIVVVSQAAAQAIVVPLHSCGQIERAPVSVLSGSRLLAWCEESGVCEVKEDSLAVYDPHTLVEFLEEHYDVSPSNPDHVADFCNDCQCCTTNLAGFEFSWEKLLANVEVLPGATAAWQVTERK